MSAGKYYRVSNFRRLVDDVMHFSARVPSVTIERRMDLAPLAAARKACRPSPTWSAIFLKGFARVASYTPALRTSYLNFLGSRFYEHATNVATLNIDRNVRGERVVLQLQIPSPEILSLAEIDALIHEHRTCPAESIPSWRRATRLSRVPRPLRRLLWRAALNVRGQFRARSFGTFGITSLGAQAGVLYSMPLLTSQLHYGVFEPDGGLDMRLSFDHRVMDGATAAGALADLEEVLLDEILRECTPPWTPPVLQDAA
jgi:hypothetical protein